MKSKAVAAGMEAGEHGVVGSEEMQTPLGRAPSLEEIRQRAYELHLQRGCPHGWDQDDWFQAEQELNEKIQAR